MGPNLISRVSACDVRTHDHGFEVETPVVIGVGSDGLEWLFSRGSDVVHELAIEVLVESALRSNSITRHQPHSSELGIKESRMVTVEPDIKHGPVRRLRDTYFAEEAVFLAIGLDSSHPRYCFSHTTIVASF